MQEPATLSAILSMLACPVCRGSLQLQPENLTCRDCNRNYPIVDGIPVLIAGESQLPQQ
jgi:uncharacterized protein